MMDNAQIRSPDELRALNNARIAKEAAKLKAAKRFAYHCVYKEINKSMAAHSSLSGAAELDGECLEAFYHVTRDFTDLHENNAKEYGRDFDYTPLGWKKSNVQKEQFFEDTVLFRFA